MSGGDLFGALQDDLVQHVLSFLPSRDAVKSAALSRRWRYLWRSTPAVRVNGSGDGFRLFVNTLLLLRDGASPLHSFEIDADLLINEESDGEYSAYDPREVDPHVDLWIKYAASRRARSLTARFGEDDDIIIMWSPTPTQPLPFASPHLATMHLHGVELDGRRRHLNLSHLDFSCCPALLNLRLSCCRLDGDTIVSPSLERLSIVDCASTSPMRISTPRLRYMQLSGDYEGICTAPSSLEIMPFLRNASIQLTDSIDGRDCKGGSAGRSLLLHGLSEATSLQLIATTADGRNRPTLEVEAEGSDNTPEQPILNFEHLKTLEIKNRPDHYYEQVVYFDTRIVEILKMFRDLGIPSCKISIDYKRPKGKKKFQLG